jgi:hypothetical protein
VKIAEIVDEPRDALSNAYVSARENVRRHAPRRARPVSAARNSPHDDPSKKIRRAKNKKSLYCCYVRRCERFSVLEPRAEGDDEGEIERPPHRPSLAGSDPKAATKKYFFLFKISFHRRTCAQA